MDINIMMMFFLPRTIPHIPSVKITIANGDMPCITFVFRMKPKVTWMVTEAYVCPCYVGL
jgi:hypothetical protein